MSDKQEREQADGGAGVLFGWPCHHGRQVRFTPADSLVKDLAAPEIVKAAQRRDGERRLENVFEFVINMNTRIVCTLKLHALLDMS